MYISLPVRSLAQEKSRELLSTRASYFLRKGLFCPFLDDFKGSVASASFLLKSIVESGKYYYGNI